MVTFLKQNREALKKKVVEESAELFRGNPDLTLYNGSVCTVLRLLRKYKHISVEKLSERSGVGEGIIRAIESGELVRKKIGPNLSEVIASIAKVFDYTTEEIFKMSDDAFVNAIKK